MTTTDPTITARDVDTIDRILDGVTKLRLSIDGLAAEVAESNRQAARDAKERRRVPSAPPVPPGPNPIFLLIIGAGLLLLVGCTLHLLGVI